MDIVIETERDGGIDQDHTAGTGPGNEGVILLV